jgi:hypothetical protein
MAGAGLTTLLVSTPASACGGFFCQTVPIDQAGESIVFAVDEPAGEIEAHVQINYVGAAADFAWVVPVPSNPQLFTSSEVLFTALAGSTPPVFSWNKLEDGTCRDDDSGWGWATADTALDFADSFFDTGSSGGGGVVVVNQQKVGPYDTVVLQAQTANDLINWLNTNNYDIPTTMGPALDPYVASGHLLLALRLTNGADVGDLVPLGMRYQATQPMVPIQLTHVAAVDDMRLDVWIFGNERAVPLNYSAVEVNPARIDWESRGDNYRDLLIEAVDEAGGQAWVTDVAADADQFAGRVLPFDIDLTPLYNVQNAANFVDQLRWAGVPGTQQLLDVLEVVVPMPPQLVAQGLDPQDFYNCMRCYLGGGVQVVFDPVVAADTIDAEILQPMRDAERLFSDYAKVTRLTTALSPGEMTRDPVFGFNPDLPNYSRFQTATLTYDCRSGNRSREEAKRRLTLPRGGSFCLPPEDRSSLDYGELIDRLPIPAAGRILQMSESGPGVELVNNRGIGFPTCAPFTLDQPAPGTAGVTNTILIRNAEPFETIHLVSGRPGSTPVPGCSGLDLDLSLQRRIATVQADADGNAEITGDVPAAFAGRQLRMQAVGYRSCRTTPTVDVQF